jgi:hypothetical protein
LDFKRSKFSLPRIAAAKRANTSGMPAVNRPISVAFIAVDQLVHATIIPNSGEINDSMNKLIPMYKRMCRFISDAAIQTNP